MIPGSQSIMLPFLKILGDRKEWGFQEIIEKLSQTFKVSHVERQEMIPSGQRIFDYRVGFSRTFFKKAALVESTRHGYLRITQNGIDLLKKNPNFIDVRLLKQIPEFIKNQASKTDIENDKTIIRIKGVKKTAANKESKLGHDIAYIQALGNLLTYYHSDLTYIREFQRYKNGQIDTNEYLKKSVGTFKAFINEYRVARNIDKTKTDVLLQMTIKWALSNNSTNVDGFAESLNLKGITHGKVMTSLASKILFLNNPWVIFPLDNQAKQSLGLRSNFYADYYPLLRDFIEKNEIEIYRYLNSIDQHLRTIESNFTNEIENIKSIRLNRFVDKILWTNGRNF
jgi:hypothetical protein